MSLSMQMMWVSILSMILLALSMFTIYLSRYKIKHRGLKIVISLTAWILLLFGGLLMLMVVLPGPTS